MESSKLNTLKIPVDDVRGSGSQISKLELIGNYSIQTIGDKSEYFNDLSQLRYYKEPADTENVHFHLGAIEIQEEVTKKETVDTEKENAIGNSEKSNTVADTEEESTPTTFLLKWILENLDSIKAKNLNKKRYLEPDFISTRGPIKALLLAPFEKYNGWILCASKFKGSIYLAQYYSDDKIEHMLNWTPEEICNLQRGFVFEEYMLSDTPIRSGDSSPRIDIDGGFYCVFKSILNNKTLLYSAEIDGIRSQQVVEDTVVGKNVELIELKTAPTTVCKHGGIKDPNRMFTWWTQCYLADVQTIMCGCKNKNGDVKRIQEIKLDEFSYRIKDKQRRCLSFCNGFLDFIKKTVSKEHDKCLYKFEFNLKKREITVDELAPNCDYAFLHPWYLEKVEDYFGKKKSASRS